MLVTLRKIAAIGLIAFLAVLGGTATASASNTDPIVKLQNSATGRCIDDSDFGFRTNTCNGSSYQRWSRIPFGDKYEFQNVATGRCIDDSDFGFRTNTCNSSSYQTWSAGLNGNNGGGFPLLNHATRRCIDDSDFGFRTNTCNFSVYQTFSYAP
jgi:hypothetical protein